MGGRSTRRFIRRKADEERKAVVIGAKEHHVCERDLKALEQMIAKLRQLPVAYRPDLGPLATKLRRASMVASEGIDPDVVTMNSRVLLRDLDDGRPESFKLVYHDEADDLHGLLSVVSELGTALLGGRVGEVVEWRYRGWTRRLRIERVVRQSGMAVESTEYRR